MEFDFSLDMLGWPVAQLSMEQEALAFWLTDELAVNADALISSILVQVGELKSAAAWEHSYRGKGYTLQLTRDEVVLVSNAVLLDGDIEMMDAEALTGFEDAQISRCGLDDFEELLLQWQRYLQDVC